MDKGHANELKEVSAHTKRDHAGLPKNSFALPLRGELPPERSDDSYVGSMRNMHKNVENISGHMKIASGIADLFDQILMEGDTLSRCLEAVGSDVHLGPDDATLLQAREALAHHLTSLGVAIKRSDTGPLLFCGSQFSHLRPLAPRLGHRGG